jgi:hypothetical protein
MLLMFQLKNWLKKSALTICDCRKKRTPGWLFASDKLYVDSVGIKKERKKN